MSTYNAATPAERSVLSASTEDATAEGAGTSRRRLLALEPAGVARVASRLPLSRSLDGFVDAVATYEALENPDVVVLVRDLRLDDRGCFHVPSIGPCLPTGWAISQFERMFGVRVDRWFNNATAEERADEVNRRLKRAPGLVRLRTARARVSSDAASLQAIVSPSYCPISNVVIARAVRAGLTGVSPVGLLRFDVTERATTIVIGIGEPFHTGGPAQVGDCYAALVIRNSGTGFCGLTAQPLLHRLKCSNGIVVAERGANVLKIRHARVALEPLKVAVAQAARDVAALANRAAKRLEVSAHHAVDDIDAAFREVLVRARLPMRLVPDVARAYAAEPHASQYGVVQAVTLAAQGWSPEQRFAAETAAGRWLVTPGITTDPAS